MRVEEKHVELGKKGGGRKGREMLEMREGKQNGGVGRGGR